MTCVLRENSKFCLQPRDIDSDLTTVSQEQSPIHHLLLAVYQTIEAVFTPVWITFTQPAQTFDEYLKSSVFTNQTQT